MRIAFFGLPLGALLLRGDGHEIPFAVLSPVEAPGGRRLAHALGVGALILPNQLGAQFEAEVDRCFSSERPDLVVSWYWTRRLPKRWLDAAPLGGIGVHPSLLPAHRGPNPFFWAIDRGDVESGVSVHRLTERYDDGAVLSRVAIPIGERNAWQLARALDRPSLVALRKIVNDIAAGNALSEEPQREENSSWAPEPTDAELRVDFHESTARVLRRIRALAPVPGLAIELQGVRFFVTRAEPARSFPQALVPGEAAAVGDPASEIVIRTGDGAIRIVRAISGAEDSDSAEPVDLVELAKLVASRTRAV